MDPSSAARESTATRGLVMGLSAAVIATVFVVLALAPAPRVETHAPGALAQLNVVLNATSFACLLAGYVSIRRGHRARHRGFMLTAFALSAAFLVSYLMHHAQVGSVPFRGQGLLRIAYFAILIPHVVLAAVIVPLALLTLVRGLWAHYPAHRRIARWTLPLWLFVSGSGVVVYLLLYHVAP